MPWPDDHEFGSHVIGCLITGANGYFGRRLASALLRTTDLRRVVLFDVANPIRDPSPPVAPELAADRIVKVAGDIRNATDVQTAFDALTAAAAGSATATAVDSKSAANAAADEELIVYHAASYGMSGKEQVAAPDRVRDINVTGTLHLLKACGQWIAEAANGGRRRRVRFVYTSTFNVVFGGDPAASIEMGDEHTPYLPLDKHCDLYSQTKSIAEQTVLTANSDRLRTVALRSAGIYGDGEERHLPRIVGLLHSGLFRFTIGTPDTRVEFVYVDNLVDAHVLASIALGLDEPPRHEHERLSSGESLPDPTRVQAVGGRGYFISDGEPINNFEFFRPLVEGLGFSYPRIAIPYWVAFRTAHVIEIVHRAVSTIYNFQPLLTRAEVNKVAVTHTFSMTAARRDLGYVPRVKTSDGMSRAVQHFVESGQRRRPLAASEQWIRVALFVLFVVVIYTYLSA